MVDAFIMAYRELLVLTKIKSRILGALINPLLWLISMGFGLSPVLSVNGASYFAFLVPGIMGTSLLFPSYFTAASLITERQFGLLKDVMIAPVSRLSIILGKALGIALYATASSFIVLIIALFLGFQLPANWFIAVPLTVVVMFLAALSFTSIGLTIATKMKDPQGYQLTGNFIVFPMFLFSGALFPLDKAPDAIKLITYVNPLSYAVDAMRFFMLGQNHIPVWIDFAVLIGITIITVFLATWSFTKPE